MVSVQTQISVTDKSQFVDGGQGTVPLFFIATEQDKLVEDAVTVASATTAATADVLQLITSQSDAIAKFGVPVFTEDSGTVQQGDELNEVGLWAMHSYLGIANRAYAVRADINLAELQATSVEPSANPANGTYWFDESNTVEGLFIANGDSTPGLAWDRVTGIVYPSSTQVDGSSIPLASFGAEGNVAIVASTTNNFIYEKNEGTWQVIGSTAWEATHDNVLTGAVVATPAATGLDTFTLTVTGGTGTATTAAMTDDTLAEVVIQVGSISGSTGVTATITGGDQLVLTTADGSDITLADGTGAWTSAGHAVGTFIGVSLTYATHSSVPVGTSTGSFWIKTTTPNNGVDWKIKQFSSSTNQWASLTNNWYSNDLTAQIALGSSLSAGDVYTQYDPDTNGDAQQVFRKLGSTAAYNVNGSVNDSANTITASDSFDFTYETAAGAQASITIVLTGEVNSFSQTVTDINTAFSAASITAAFEATETAITGGNAVRLTAKTGKAFILAENVNTPLSDMGITAGQKSNFAALTYTAAATAPVVSATENTLWYDETFKIDILIGDGAKWEGPVNSNASFDPEGVQISATKPLTQAAPGSGALVSGDVWLDSGDVANFPALYRWNTTLLDFEAVDNTDQTTPFGIVFDDVRENAGPAYSGSTHTALSTDPTQLAISDYVDPDAPDPQLYPAGTILFNTRYSTQNIKKYKPNYFGLATTNDFQLTGTTFTVGGSATFTNPGESANLATDRWVNESGNQLDGAMYGNRKAQRAVIVQAIAASVAGNDDVRSEFIEYSLMTAPGYVELLDELQTLNVDRKETAFIVSDTPSRLAPNGTDILNWATNINNAASNGEIGRTTRYTYSTMSYPGMALGTNLDGNEIAVPGSAVKMRTIAFSDSVSYPWKPAAGLRRGVISNAASVGYITSEDEYQSVILKEGLRDTLYDNNINPHAVLPGAGLVVWGDKTMHQQSSALDRENVARLIVHIRTDLDRAVRPYFFELNNERTRADVKDMVERYLADLVSKEAMYDFVVVVSDQNNTPTRIDKNELWIDIAIEPQKSIDFIFIPIRIVNTGTL